MGVDEAAWSTGCTRGASATCAELPAGDLAADVVQAGGDT
jgi:hypothetical protein